MTNTITKKRPSEIRTDAPPPMVHLVEDENDMIAICGAPLLGIPVPDGTPTDCVVCAEMDRQYREMDY